MTHASEIRRRLYAGERVHGTGRGYRLLGYGHDIAVLRAGYERGLAALREIT